MSYDFDDELLSAYLDDELSTEERAVVERLLAERPEARRLLEELRQVQESLRSLPTLRLGDDFEAGVLRHAEREVLRAPSSAAIDGDAGAGSIAGTGIAGTGAVAETGGGAKGVAPSESAPTVVPSQVTAAGILPSGDALGDRGLSEDWQRSGRWRRPLAWSIMATAAALVFMYVDSQQHANRALVLHQPPAAKTTASSAPADVAAARPTELLARDEQAGGGFTQSMAAGAGGAPMVVGGGSLSKIAGAPAEAMKGEASQPVANGAADKSNGLFVIQNGLPPTATAPPNGSTLSGVPAAVSPPGSQMSVFNTIPPAAGPHPAPVAAASPAPSSPATATVPLPSATPAVPPAANLAVAKSSPGRFAVVDNLSAAGGTGGNAGGGGSAPTNPQFTQPLAPANDMATQIVSQAVSQQYGYGSYTGRVDTTPLVAASDYRRAQTLLADYETLRRRSPDAKQAVDSLRQRLRTTSDADRTRLAARKLAADAGAGSNSEPLPEAAAKSNAKNSPPNDDARSSSNEERLVIVYCDVTPEAWERGLAPVLRREQIADLTALQVPSPYAASRNQTATGPTTSQEDRVDGAADRRNRASTAEREEFYYVVAGKPQLAAALDALRNQSEYFLNVEVESASSAVGEQTWRAYSRGQNVRGTNRDPSREATEKQQVGSAAATASRSAGNGFADAKELQANLSGALQMPAAMEAERLQAQVQQQSAPLSRAQRIVPATTAAEGNATATATPGVTAATAGKPQAAVPPTSGGAKFGNEAPRGAAAGEALGDARPAQAKPMGQTAASPRKKTDAPTAGDVAIAKNSEAKDNQTGDLRTTEIEAAKRLAEPPAFGQAASTVWLGLPEDFHEALFIFRVVDRAEQPMSNVRPAADAKPADDASRK